jgi:hypothetical protein
MVCIVQSTRIDESQPLCVCTPHDIEKPQVNAQAMKKPTASAHLGATASFLINEQKSWWPPSGMLADYPQQHRDLF